jgi:hypothetical protein
LMTILSAAAHGVEVNSLDVIEVHRYIWRRYG